MKHILAFCLLLISVTVLAVPAKRIKKNITLADGTQKEVVLVGDENIHYYLDAENVAYTCDEKGVFRKDDRRKLEDKWKERLARRNKHRIERAEARGLNMTPKTMQEPSLRHRAQWGAEQNPISGDKTGLVILVNFPDKVLKDAHGQEYYGGFFNQVGFSKDGNYGSVHDYFYECSYGLFNVTFDIYGPVTVSKSYTYYGKNDSSGYDLYPGEMVIEVCDLAHELGVDFSKYDWDGDGMVDQVFLIYAGYGENAGAPTNTIWPHECTLTEEADFGDGNGPVTYDGVTVDTYAVSCELDNTVGSTPAGIGTACHEFSHCMCLPDFYDTSGNTYYGMDAWDLMDYGTYSGNNHGNCPAPYTSYERMYCGWLTPKVLNEPCFVTDMKTLYETPEAYIIYNDANHNEYYMLENRQGEGFDAFSPAKGMLVLHVYFDREAWKKNTVNYTSMQRMTIIPADGILSSTSNRGDTWPGRTGNRALTDDSNPAAKLYATNLNGEKLMGKPIEDIEDVEGRISFVFNGGVAIGTPVALKATGVSDDGFTARWDAVEGVTRYNVQLTATDLAEQQYTLADLALLQEDFNNFNNGNTTDGSIDIGEMLDNYTAVPNWEGEKLYTTPQNEVKMGSARIDGFLYTPWLTPKSDIVTLVFTARSYNDTTSELQLAMGFDYEGDAIKEIQLTSESVRYIFPVKTMGKAFWWGLTGDGRCYISEMCAYEGELTEEEIAEGVVSRRSTQTSEVETDGNSYVFTNLSNQRKYSYTVCALNDKVRSKWSNAIEVRLQTDEETALLNVNVNDNVNHYYSLDGRKIPALQRGVNIVRMADGTVRKIVRP